MAALSLHSNCSLCLRSFMSNPRPITFASPKSALPSHQVQSFGSLASSLCSGFRSSFTFATGVGVFNEICKHTVYITGPDHPPFSHFFWARAAHRHFAGLFVPSRPTRSSFTVVQKGESFLVLCAIVFS